MRSQDYYLDCSKLGAKVLDVNKTLILLPVLGAFVLTSCLKKKETAERPLEYPYKVTATVGMIADVTRQIAGDQAEVTNIIGEGIDPHSYSAGPSEIKQFSNADLVLYNGLHLEGKMGQVLGKQSEKKPVFAVAEGLLDSDYKIIGGEAESDPHVWMDVTGWIKVTRAITTRLAQFDSRNAVLYEENSAAYQKKLVDLDNYARQCFTSIPENQRVLVTAHDAFSYLGRAYGIEVRSIQGISTESKAGLQDINRLVKYLVDQKIPAVFVESSVPKESVTALIEGANAQSHKVIIGGELFSDAMGPAGSYEGTYIGMIDYNITTITRALGGQAPEMGLNGKLSH